MITYVFRLGLYLLKKSQTITEEFSNIVTSSKRRPFKLKSHRGKDWYNSIFQNLLKTKNIHHYSRFTDKGPSIAERVIKTIRNFLKKPVFLKGIAAWLSELPSVVRKNNTIHSSTKVKPNDGSQKSNEKTVFNNLKNKKQKHKPKLELGQLVRTADIKRALGKSDSTNWSFNFYTTTEVIHDTIPSNRIDYSPERYIENLLRSTNITLGENNQVMKKRNLIQ